MKKIWFIIVNIVLITVIASIFSYVYFYNHAYGAWGDDSPGYIYLWGRMAQKKPLVYQEPLTVKALQYFKEEKLARWTTPTHHDIISPSGNLASRYPIGLSLLMLFFQKIFNNDTAIYNAIPFFAVANLILLYLIIILLFKDSLWRFLYGLSASLLLGFSSLYFDHSVCQPMREIPSIFFILFSFYLLIVLTKYKNKKTSYLLIILSSLAFGFSINIRETSAVLLPAFFIFLFSIYRDETKIKKIDYRKIFKLSILSLLVMIIAYLPSIINSWNITQYKEKFKKKDITNIAITSNFDHIQSFAISNLWQNNGKFRPGEGGLAYYWQWFKDLTIWPIFMIVVISGLIFLFKKNKYLALSIFMWVVSVLFIFSIWVNPYSRYILPAYPALIILFYFGIDGVKEKIYPELNLKKIHLNLFHLLILLSIIASVHPAISAIKYNHSLPKEDILVFKAISLEDLNNLKALGSKLTNNQQKKPLVIFSGVWQYGISETFEAHTGVQSVRMPLEQEKFSFDPDQVANFFNSEIFQNYEVYWWADSTTRPQTRLFFKNYNKEKIDTASHYSFDDIVTVYKVEAQSPI